MITTLSPTDQERMTAEVATCIHMTELAPQNEHWQDRLAAAIVEEHRAYNPEADFEQAWAALLEFVEATTPVADDLGESGTETRTYLLGL